MKGNFGGQSFKFSAPYKNMEQAATAQNEWITGAADARATGYGNAMKRWTDTFQPYQGFGGKRVNAWDKLLSDPSSITSNPGYQFRRQQGREGLENSAAARGGLLSGNALRGINEYEQDYASNEYDKALNREATGAQFGATVDTNYANALSQLEEKLGLSNAQKFGDFSNYAFWHEQQGMDEAKQWMGVLRGISGGGMGGGSSGGGSGSQPKSTGFMGGGNGNNQNAFLSYYNNNSANQNNQLGANSAGDTDYDEYMKRGTMYMGY